MQSDRSAPWARMNRRGLLRSGMGGVAAAIVANAFALDALAQGQRRGYAYFSNVNARTLEAVVARLWPETDTPGAVEIGVPQYIDDALVSAYRDLRVDYQDGLAKIDAAATARHGAPFAELGTARQDELLERLQDDDLPGFAEGKGRAFFELLHRHTMEGLFSDPIHGGNRNLEAWRQVGYPGPFYFISGDQQQSFEPLDMPIQSIADL